MQEEPGCWCTTVEGIKAEGEAIIFGVQMLLQLKRHTHSHKHITRKSIIFSLCFSRMQKLRVVKDEV